MKNDPHVFHDIPTAPPARSDAKHPNPGTSCQGAMSQQGCGAHGNDYYPQEFMQLVGYRNPDADPDACARPKPNPRAKPGVPVA